jgi:hypothetical protein
MVMGPGGPGTKNVGWQRPTANYYTRPDQYYSWWLVVSHQPMRTEAIKGSRVRSRYHTMNNEEIAVVGSCSYF